MSNLLIILAIIALPLVFLIGLYNSLAALRIKVKEAWSHIDVHLKRRTDLIPNLVETVKGYAAHEKEVFENVTRARAALMGAGDAKQAAQAENMLSGALKNLFAVAEAYPELRASENFKQLQADLTDTEDKIAYARQFYNSVVRDYNSKLAVFPSNLVGSIFGFKPEAFFEPEGADREPVKVSFTK